ASSAPTPITRVAAAPSRTGGLVDPFDMPSTPARPAPRAPAPRPTPVVAAPTPRPTPVAAPRPNDPFNNVYSDPTQRRPTVRPRVQAPPSAHTGAIITEF
ncbi:MAG: hypothetical protein JWM10_5374, partial [Myxococcaceae bacterium]|nr:hypothetical protein [Myxococcaceae bacterium]